MRVVAASRNWRSWLAITIGTRPVPAIQRSSSWIFARSRWLVGSSRSSASGSVIQARAISASLCQPPLSAFTGRSRRSAGVSNSSSTTSTRQLSASRPAGGSARQARQNGVKTLNGWPAWVVTSHGSNSRLALWLWAIAPRCRKVCFSRVSRSRAPGS